MPVVRLYLTNGRGGDPTEIDDNVIHRLILLTGRPRLSRAADPRSDTFCSDSGGGDVATGTPMTPLPARSSGAPPPSQARVTEGVG